MIGSQSTFQVVSVVVLWHETILVVVTSSDETDISDMVRFWDNSSSRDPRCLRGRYGVSEE